MTPPLLSVPGVKGRGHSKGVRVDVVTAPIEVDVVVLLIGVELELDFLVLVDPLTVVVEPVDAALELLFKVE